MQKYATKRYNVIAHESSTKGLQTMQELLYKDVTQNIHSVDNVDLCQDTTLGLTDRGMITDVATLGQ